MISTLFPTLRKYFTFKLKENINKNNKVSKINNTWIQYNKNSKIIWDVKYTKLAWKVYLSLLKKINKYQETTKLANR